MRKLFQSYSNAQSRVYTKTDNPTQPAALWSNATAAIGTPTWRYYFNATFSNTQPLPGLGAFHASEIPLVFRTYPQTNTTTQQYALAQSLQSTWARFARNPLAGPGWNQVGTGAAANISFGAYEQTRGGLYQDGNASVVRGDWSVGVFGDVGNVRGSGITVLSQADIDFRCALFKPVYEAAVGKEGMPPA